MLRENYCVPGIGSHDMIPCDVAASEIFHFGARHLQMAWHGLWTVLGFDSIGLDLSMAFIQPVFWFPEIAVDFAQQTLVIHF